MRRSHYRHARTPPPTSGTPFGIDVFGWAWLTFPRALRERFPFYLWALPSVFPQKNLKIPSLLTTVRRRPDRSRPPQVGPTGHTCTASADRTAPAKHFQASHSLPFPLPNFRSFSATRSACTLPPRRTAQPSAESGGRGGLVPTLSGNYFPRRGPGQRPGGSCRSRPFLPFSQILRKVLTTGVRSSFWEGRNQRMRLSARNQVHWRLA